MLPINDVQYKLIIRHLPPNLNREEFIDTLKQWSHLIGYLRFVPGKPCKASMGVNIPGISPLAYISLKDLKQVQEFATFCSNKYTDCKVEPAIYQEVPLAADGDLKLDGTVFSDTDYLKFNEKGYIDNSSPKQYTTEKPAIPEIQKDSKNGHTQNSQKSLERPKVVKKVEPSPSIQRSAGPVRILLKKKE